MKTLEDERYVVIKAYKCTVSEIWRDSFVLAYIACTSYPYIQSIAVAFEHCALRDHVRQELSVGGASRKWHGLEYARVWKPCRHFA